MPRELSEREKWLLAFWKELADSMRFDDPSQPPPKPSTLGNMFLRMPSPRAWITLYFSTPAREMGIFLTFNRGEPGSTFYERLTEKHGAIETEVPSGIAWDSDGTKHRISLKRPFPSTSDPTERAEAMRWFFENANLFVNAFRPRIARYQEEL